MRTRLFLFILLCLLRAVCFASPSPPLLKLLDKFQVVHDGSWESIQKVTEQRWLSHGRNVELWEIDKLSDPGDLKESFDLFTQLGMTQTVLVPLEHYDYALLLGATEGVVRSRLLFLKSLWDAGLRFDQLVVLTGDRPLADFERQDVRNETELINKILEETELPEEWQDLVVVVDTPKPPGLLRPHTGHTMEHWLHLEPHPDGSKLLVSNQPFVFRQHAIAKKYFDDVYPVGHALHFEQVHGRLQMLLAELAQRIRIEYEDGTVDSSVGLSVEQSCCCSSPAELL